LALVDRPPPKPSEIFTVPPKSLTALQAITAKLHGSKAKWAVGGDMAELLQGVHLSLNGIEIFTDGEGLTELFDRLADFDPTPISTVEARLGREAEIEGKMVPVFVKSNCTRLKVLGTDLCVHGEYQVKVGDWEWGDAVVFEPIDVNITGVVVPVMPIRLSSEIYLSLGWMDRVESISAAIARAHHALHAEQRSE
jgi:hypothetical protein